MQVILGDGGHARELQSICGGKLIGKNDPVPPEVDVIIGIGDLAGRKRLFEQYENRCDGVIANPPCGYWAIGIQVMRGVVLCSGIRFGINVLVNTGAQIDHDCKIGDHCVIAPGAILCGGVTLGEGCFIGAGAIIVEGVTLESATFVPAGTLVVGQDDMRYPERRIPLRVGTFEIGPTFFGGLEEQSPGDSLHSDTQPDRHPDGEGAS